MKYFIVFFIVLYQVIFSPFIHAITGNTNSCRYQPTCSEYAKKAISKSGVIKGLPMAFRRLSSCHPFAKTI